MKMYKHVMHSSSTRFSPDGGPGWYVVEERREGGDSRFRALAGPFTTRAEAEGRLVGNIE